MLSCVHVSLSLTPPAPALLRHVRVEAAAGCPNSLGLCVLVRTIPLQRKATTSAPPPAITCTHARTFDELRAALLARSQAQMSWDCDQLCSAVFECGSAVFEVQVSFMLLHSAQFYDGTWQWHEMQPDPIGTPALRGDRGPAPLAFARCRGPWGGRRGWARRRGGQQPARRAPRSRGPSAHNFSRHKFTRQVTPTKSTRPLKSHNDTVRAPTLSSRPHLQPAGVRTRTVMTRTVTFSSCAPVGPYNGVTLSREVQAPARAGVSQRTQLSWTSTLVC